MLIEFSLTNIRSFRERQTLSLAASSYFKDLEKENCFDTEMPRLPRLLRSIAIYGPNASGKSNLLSALDVMRGMVLFSAKGIQEGEGLPITPFKLDGSSKEKESELEVIFIEEGVRYQYGFALNQQRVLREWLIAYPEGRPQRWFERTYDKTADADKYEFGPKFLGGRLRQDWKGATRSNALFLSVAVQFNSEQLKPVYNWFQLRLHIIRPRDFPESGFMLDFTVETCATAEGKKKVLDFLGAADLSIADISMEKSKFTPEKLPKDLPFDVKELLGKQLEGEDITDIKFMHKNIESGELVAFALREESGGTRNLFNFAGPWHDVIEKDAVLFVDEIDSSLHPLVVHQLIRLLHKSAGKAQIVFTTHDTTILSQKFMRRDQIWFIEKDSANASRLYPLSDFRVRKDEALENNYLRGRYGAIPFIPREIIGA